MPPHEILLVEDSLIDATIVLKRMEVYDDMRFHWVESLQGCLAFLEANKVAAILLDLNLGDAAGTGLIDSVRKAARDIPIIILTGTSEEDVGLHAVRHGCQDFLVKGRTDGPLIRQTLLHSLERNALVRAVQEAEERARRGEEQALLILDAAPQAMLVIDPDGRVVRANSQASDIFGLDHQTTPNQRFADLLPPRIRACMGPVPRQSAETTGLRADGTEFPMRLSLGSMRFADANYLVAGIEDLTERKAADMASRLHGEIFTHAREGVLVTDAQGAVLSANPAFCRMLGYELAEITGKRSDFMRSDRHSPDFFRQMWRDLRLTGHWTGEIWNRRRDGEVVPQWVSMSAVRDHDGRITNLVAVYMDMSSAKRHEEDLHHMAHHDALTGLPNRLLLTDRIGLALAQARRKGTLVAVAYLDLDGFKPINDRLGHHVGDVILQETAKRMLSVIRDGDTVARLGGDEFVLLLGDLDGTDQAGAVLDRLLATIAKPYRVNGRDFQLTASIGVAIYPLDDSDSDTLLRHADQAMYAAKHGGKNRFALYDPEQEHKHRLRVTTTQMLYDALAQGQFILFYQPKVNMRRGTVIGAEALIRWLHPERGLLPPSEFLPLVEEAHLEARIGEWVVRSSLAQISGWMKQGAALPISVNIAAGHLLSEGFVERLGQILAEFPEVPPRMLQIEVVENAALEDVGRAREVLDACRVLGVSAALDDFGTGYSSLTYLRHLPIDTLKIDRSFVLNLHDDQEDLTIVKGVIVLASGFGHNILAEGIEKTEHGEMLLKLGCELGQGYHIAPPMPAGDFLRWLDDWQPEERWMTH